MQASVVIIFAVITYFICGIPFGLIVGRYFGEDVRTKGSGNVGSTNVARTVSKRAGIYTLLMDVAKGFLCTFAASHLMAYILNNGDPSAIAATDAYGWYLALIYVVAIIGHIFSPYLHFKGGKGVAVGLGASLGFIWPMGLFSFVVWATVVAITKKVSLASVMAAFTQPIFAAVFCVIVAPTYNLSVTSIVIFTLHIVVAGALVIWAHRENIARLKAGTEPEFSLK